MMLYDLIAVLLLALTALHLASIACALLPAHRDGRNGTPPVTIIRPLCGLETFSPATLESTFQLNYPSYEVIFCVEDAKDPVVPLARALIQRHPDIPARLLVGVEHINANPKLNNVAKGWRAAQHGWIVMADSNVLMPADYLRRLFAAWDKDTGLVCSPPVGCAPEGLAAEIECSFLNAHQARWQYAADFFGRGFAQGKSMLWRRDILERAGGIERLGAELAEDAAATKVIREAGLNVRIARDVSPQPLGPRTFKAIWQRQLRWARLRRDSFLLCFLPEIFTGIVPALLLAGITAQAAGLSLLPALVAFAALWYGAEILLAYGRGWHLSLLALAALPLRDLLMPAVWIASWMGNGFVWHGNSMTLAERGGDA